MDIIANILFYSILFSLVAMVVKLFERGKTFVRLSFWARMLALSSLGFMVFVAFESYIKWGRLNLDLNPVSWIGIIAPFYATYGAWMFRYQYDEHAFSWFNGLIVRSVKSDNVKKIVLLEQAGKIRKISFITEGGEKKLRNDLNIEDLVLGFSRLKGIVVERRTQ